MVGTPISVEQCSDPTEHMVQDAHERYFGEIRRIFEQHKVAAGYKDSRLIFI